MRIDHLTRVAEVLGLELAATLYQNGDPVRDRAHLALLARFRERLAPGVRVRTEVPIPITGDRRSGDAVVSTAEGDVLVEAETHLGDIQAVERRIRAKARDLGAVRLVLLLSDTRHNREVLRLHAELRAGFPIRTRECLGALGRGRAPAGDAIVFV